MSKTTAEKTPVAVYSYYLKASEFSFNSSVITYSTLNSKRVDKGRLSIFYLYDSLTDKIIGEYAAQVSSIPSLNSSNITYNMAKGIINLYDKEIIFNYYNGSIKDTLSNKRIFGSEIVYTYNSLGNPVEIKPIMTDPVEPEFRYYYTLSEFSK